MSLLAVDIGNTSTTLGLFDGSGAIIRRFDIPTRTLTHRALTRETLDAPLTGLPTPSVVAVASVVPWASEEIVAVLMEVFTSAEFLVVTSSNIPMRLDYPNPDELGSDRVIGAYAAFKLYGEAGQRPCIVVDMGTATTYDCVTAEGTYLGGAIAPGLEVAAEALTQRAAQLPSVEIVFPASIIGRTTVESIQSGVLYGGLAQFEGMVARLTEFRFSDERPIVVATGGLSSLLEGRTQIVTHFAPALVLEGIRFAAKQIIADKAVHATTLESDHDARTARANGSAGDAVGGEGMKNEALEVS